jgi:hypothetical protein
MGERAHIGSVEALAELRPAVIRFAESCQQGLMTSEGSVRRAVSWLTGEQLPRWRAEVRRGEEEVTRTHSVMKSRMTGFGGQPQAKVDDVLAWEKAKRRLEEARRKLEATERWSRVLAKASEEYRGAVSPLGWFVRAELGKAVGALDAMGAALEAYEQIGSAKAGSGRAEAAAGEAGVAGDQDGASGGDHGPSAGGGV